MSGAFAQRHHESISSESDVRSDLLSPAPEEESLSPYYYTRENYGFEAARHEAIKVWARRTKLACLAQLVVIVLFFVRQFVLTTLANVLMVLLGIYGSIATKSEPMFAYLILNLLNAIKDIGLMYTYKDTLIPAEWALVLVDLVIVTPIACYTGFYLYQSLQTQNLDNLRRSQVSNV